jgi:hypothetical protein
MRLLLIATLAKFLGVQVHHEGRPLGGRPRKISSADCA